MILKVRCQICGKIGEVDTLRANPSFHFYTISEVFPEIKEEANWEFWLCSRCSEKFEEWRERAEEIYYDLLVQSLKIEKSEIE